jgi:hypothetical protein
MQISKIMNTIDRIFPYARVFHDEQTQHYTVVYQGTHNIFYKGDKIILFSDYMNDIFFDKLNQYYDLQLLAYFPSLISGYTKRVYNRIDIKIYEIK